MAIDSSSEHLFSSLHTCTGEIQHCLMITNYKVIDLAKAVAYFSRNCFWLKKKDQYLIKLLVLIYICIHEVYILNYI